MATSKEPASHAVNKDNIALVVKHYPELHRFVAMVNGDFDKQCAVRHSHMNGSIITLGGKQIKPARHDSSHWFVQELCMDFLTNNLLITLLHQNGFERDAMVGSNGALPLMPPAP